MDRIWVYGLSLISFGPLIKSNELLSATSLSPLEMSILHLRGWLPNTKKWRGRTDVQEEIMLLLERWLRHGKSRWWRRIKKVKTNKEEDVKLKTTTKADEVKTAKLDKKKNWNYCEERGVIYKTSPWFAPVINLVNTIYCILFNLTI